MCYDKKSELHVGEFILTDFDISLFRTIYNLDYSDIVYGCYPYTKEINEKYPAIASYKKLDFNKYDYFIESYEE
jgi:hypothetical protein